MQLLPNIPYAEVLVTAEEASLWDTPASASVTLAAWWNRFGPIGKGAFPRLLGRLGSRARKWMPTKSGAKLAIHQGSMEVYAYMKNHEHTWNNHVFKACRELLNGGDVFYDIGANIGFISIELAASFKGDLRVIAIEPQPELSRNIAISAQLNNFDGVHVYGVMLGETPGAGQLYVTSHTIHASSIPREKESKCIQCPISTIDQLVQSGCIPEPKVIKIDIEGGELAAFKGARETIAHCRPHIVFESDENMKRFGYGREDVLTLLSSLADYQFCFISPAGTLIPMTEATRHDYTYYDILASVPTP